jgi:hypothetical protein
MKIGSTCCWKYTVSGLQVTDTDPVPDPPPLPPPAGNGISCLHETANKKIIRMVSLSIPIDFGIRCFIKRETDKEVIKLH